MNGDKKPVTNTMLFGDAIITFLLINEARRRIVVWVFGVPKEDSELITVIATGSLAKGVQSRARVIAAWVVETGSRKFLEFVGGQSDLRPK